MCKGPKPGTGAPIDMHRKAFNAGKNDPVKRALGITKGKKSSGGSRTTVRSAFATIADRKQAQ